MVPRPKKAVTEGDMEARLIAVDDFLYSLKNPYPGPVSNTEKIQRASKKRKVRRRRRKKKKEHSISIYNINGMRSINVNLSKYRLLCLSLHVA